MPAFFCLRSLRCLRPGPVLPGGYLESERVEVREFDHSDYSVEAEDI